MVMNDQGRHDLPPSNEKMTPETASTNAGGLPPLYNHCIDDYRRMKVICIGAGLSGILAAIRFPQRIANLDFVIYEKNEEVGGTWWENTYPGVRCDVPSAVYQYTFENNTQWSEYYCTGGEIENYLIRVAHKYGAYRYIKFRTELKAATWHENEGKWRVKILDLTSQKEFDDECDFLVLATGILNKWKWPDIEGRELYRGKIVHSAHWDPDLTLEKMKDLDIALIGAGSSGIQILPQIQPVARTVDHYMSGKTWISPIGFGSEELQERGAIGNFKHSEEELNKFKKDPKAYLAWRSKIEKIVNSAALITLYGSPVQKEFMEVNREAMREKLAKKAEIMEALEPSWPPGCRRLTPGPGYLEALVEDNVNFIPTKIKRFTEAGIQTIDGKERRVDLIICATGFDTTLKQPIPILGQGGASLNDVWDPIPEAYYGIFPPKMPNLMRFLGPNGASGTGGLVHLLEEACEFMIKAVQKAQREYLKSIVPKPRAMRNFTTHVDNYFKKTIYTQPCRSWMKRGKEDGRVVTIWPGSAIHTSVAYKNPRWEDFDYAQMPETDENSLCWLGSGLTVLQEQNEHTADYLEEVDQPPIVNHEIDTGGLVDPSRVKIDGV